MNIQYFHLRKVWDFLSLLVHCSRIVFQPVHFIIVYIHILILNDPFYSSCYMHVNGQNDVLEHWFGGGEWYLAREIIYYVNQSRIWRLLNLILNWVELCFTSVPQFISVILGKGENEIQYPHRYLKHI